MAGDPPDSGHNDDAREESRDDARGNVRVTGPGPLVGFFVAGLVGGWAVRPLSLQLSFSEPSVPLISVAALLFVAAALGASAFLTRRVVRRDRPSLSHHHALNRLMLGKACALAGALVAGGYFGFALAQLGIDQPAAEARLWRSALAGLAGTTVCATALLLEHACRVPPDSE